jgi:hypothetical protein
MVIRAEFPDAGAEIGARFVSADSLLGSLQAEIVRSGLQCLRPTR